MNKSLQGRFREVIHNNYTLYYFVYMYVHKYALKTHSSEILTTVNNQYSYSYVKGAKWNRRCVADSKVA